MGYLPRQLFPYPDAKMISAQCVVPMTLPPEQQDPQAEGYTPSEQVTLEIEILASEIAARQAKRPRKRKNEEEVKPGKVS